MTQPSFGRRSHAAPTPAPLPVMTKFSRAGNAASKPDTVTTPSVDEELKAWKQARGFSFPIRLLALMASLCFGIASVALPQAVNDWVQYPLYALSAASLYAGFRRKRRNAAGS